MANTLKLFNTLSRSIEDFKPLDPANVRMYVCGITPYDDAHIGHARVYVVFDVLYRLLQHLYPKVTYVRNFTDIDDKILARAAETGDTPAELSERFMDSFAQDMAALNVSELPEQNQPRVSNSLQEIVDFVDQLLNAGIAYKTADGDVMFDTAQFPDFGKLAHRKLDEQRHGERVKVDADKRNLTDFVLWKANVKSSVKMEQAIEPRKFGAKHFDAVGRPGWHIECSAMSRKIFGEGTFDIHGGGEDLVFPHHSCEIAQTEALTQEPMARFWVHNSFITVNGTKMSKSLGNFTTIKDALAKYSPEAIRFWLLQTHYQDPVDFTDESLKNAEAVVDKVRRRLSILPNDIQGDFQNKGYYQSALNALNDCLNTYSASMIWQEAAVDAARAVEVGNISLANQIYTEFKKVSELLGLDIHFGNRLMSSDEKELYDMRLDARANKNWKESDRLRDELLKVGIIVEDNLQGTNWRRK